MFVLDKVSSSLLSSTGATSVGKKRQGNDDSESDNSDEYRRSIAKQPKGKNKGMLM